jgi:RHS repeat-associated protein
VFIEERNNTWNTPYLFNAKELDEETGLYYYGARYYDPRISLWLSVDALLINGYYLDGNHNGGVYNSFNLNPYSYCRVNPVLYFDPDGNQFKAIREWWINNNVGTRAIGGLQMVGGVAEAIVGGVGGVLSSETGVGAVLGYAVLMNGIDNTVAGATQMWTGESTNTLLHQGISETSKALGADNETAEKIADAGEMGITLGVNIGNAKNIANIPKTLAAKNTSAATNATKESSNVLSKSDYLRIENAATRINKPITVVGSRASGTAKAYSDWDYVIPGLNSRKWSSIKNSLPGARSVLDNTPRNIDIFKGPLDVTKPHIIINPQP